MAQTPSGVKPTNHTEAPSSKTRTRAESIDQNQLRGDDRGKWEESVLRGLDDKALDHLVRALFDNARGKADCFPKNDTLAKKTKLSEKNGGRHVRRLLNELAVRGVVALVNDPSIRSRRRIVFLSHPNAESVLAALPPGANVRPRPDKMSASKSASAPDKMSASRGALMFGQGGHPDPPNPKGNPEKETSLKTTPLGSAEASSRADAPACEGDPAADPIAMGAGGRFVADDSSGDGDDWAAKFMAYVGRVAAEVKRLGERIELDDLGLFQGRVQWQPGETPEAMAGRLVAKYAELANWRPENTDDPYVFGVEWEPGDTPETMAERVVAKFIEAEAGMIAGDDEAATDPAKAPGSPREAIAPPSATTSSPEAPKAFTDIPGGSDGAKPAKAPSPPKVEGNVEVAKALDLERVGPSPSPEAATAPAKAPESPREAPKAVEASIPSSEATGSLVGDSRPFGEKAQPDPAAKAETDRRRREEREAELAERREREDQNTDRRCREALANPDAPPWTRESALEWLRKRGKLNPDAEAVPTPKVDPVEAMDPVEVGAGGIDDDIDF